MAWKFDLIAGPFKGRTAGLAWDGKTMLVCAVGEERVVSYNPANRKTTDFRRWTGRVGAVAIAKDGTVFAAQEGGRRVVRFMKDGTTTPTEELLDGAHHNQPCDIVLDKKGSAWFADAYNGNPPYGPPAFPFLPHASVIRMDPYGTDLFRLNRVTHDTLGPQAVALSANEKILYVADGDVDRGDVCQLFAYPIDKHGVAGHRKTLLNFAFGERGITGMCLDSEGNIICCLGWNKSGSGAAIIVVSPGGTILETHPAPADMPVSCAFGDASLSTLYVTANGGLYRARNTGHKGRKR